MLAVSSSNEKAMQNEMQQVRSRQNYIYLHAQAAQQKLVIMKS